MDELVMLGLGAVLDKATTEIDVDASFIYNGGNSLSAAALASKCRAQRCSLTIRTILMSESIQAIIDTARLLPGKKVGVPLSEEVHNTSESSPPLSITEESSRSSCTSRMGSPIQGFRHEHTHFPPSNGRFSLPSRQISLDQIPSSHSASSSGLIRGQQKIPTPAETPSVSSTPVRENSPPRSASPISSFDFGGGQLTEMQLSLIHGSKKTPGMNIITHIETFLTRDIPILKLAWKTIIEQEPIFHVRALLPHDGNAFHWHNPATDEEDTRQTAYKAYDQSQIGSFFEVIAQQLIPGQEPRSALIWKVHHALIDGFSADILFDKVRQVMAGKTVRPGPPFSETVKDFRLLQESCREEGNAFWAVQLAQNCSTRSNLLLPSVDQQLEHSESQSADILIHMGLLHERLISFARDSNVTSSVVLNAAWALVLSRYADSDTVMFGAVLSGRDLPLPNVTTTIGPLVNTLPFFVTVDRERTAKHFLRSILENMIKLREFQWTMPVNGYSRNFESALAVQSGQPESSGGYVSTIGRPQTKQATEIPLSVVVEADGMIQFNYHHTRYSQQNIERLGACYYEAIRLLLTPNLSVGSIMEGLLSCSSQALLLQFGNCYSGLTTRTSIKQDLVTLFESSVRKYPEQPAIEQGDLYLTYKELDEAANKVAERLKGNIEAGDVVCVHSDRSANWIIAIYGILKAEGVYCSLDSGLPAELRNLMYSSAGAKVYLTPSVDEMEYCPASCTTCWAIESILEEERDIHNLFASHRQQPLPWMTAYLCFTSGSTGTPKGVMCAHEGLVAFQSDLQVRLFAQVGTKVSQIMSPAFDGSIHEIFSALSYGATLVLQVEADPFGHLGLVDSAILTPSMARVLNPQDYERLENVYLVGEPVPQVVSEKWSTQKQLYNMYGPTEGTCGATIKHLTPGSQVTVGSPNPTTRVYILDSHQSLALPGIIGEIYLGGVQVAQGYLNLEEQTKHRFLPDSICRNGERMYKTGDRGYWSETGEVVCLGRNDRQIKLRGYRLDMNDLEIRILKAAQHLEAVAIAQRGDHLVAIVQPVTTNIGELRTRITSVLPSYATMQHIVAVDQIPMTSTGKVDYKLVSSMEFDSSKRQARNPSTATEKAVAVAFKSILKLDGKAPLNTDSDFIQLGGHSLLQLSLNSRLNKSFSFCIPLRLIIENPTLGGMAQIIDKYKTSTKPVIPRGQTLGSQQVSPIEREWLQKYDVDSGSACFNVCFTCTFDECIVNRSALTSAWNIVLARHTLFRGRYLTRPGKAPLRVDADFAPLVERLSELSLWKEVNRPFHVHRASPIRVSITKDRLLVIMSHIVADYTALSTILKEASAAYDGQSLGPIGKRYPDSSVWYDSVPPCYLDFWTHYLEKCDENPALLGRQQERTGYHGTSVISRISAIIYKEMVAYCDTSKLSLQQLVMAAVALCLQLDTAETDIVIGSPYINRNSDEDLEMIGLFLEPLPVRIRYPNPLPQPHEDEEEELHFLNAVQKSSQSALAHVMPWHQLLNHLGITPSFPTHPLFDVMVTFHDNSKLQGLNMAAQGFESCFIWSEGAKFKLMCEFTTISEDRLLLRLEYASECIPEQDIKMIQALVPRALELLVKGKTHEEIKERLREEAGQVGGGEQQAAENFFGKRFCDL